jgi:hypothetical protein
VSHFFFRKKEKEQFEKRKRKRKRKKYSAKEKNILSFFAAHSHDLLNSTPCTLHPTPNDARKAFWRRKRRHFRFLVSFLRFLKTLSTVPPVITKALTSFSSTNYYTIHFHRAAHSAQKPAKSRNRAFWRALPCPLTTNAAFGAPCVPLPGDERERAGRERLKLILSLYLSLYLSLRHTLTHSEANSRGS